MGRVRVRWSAAGKVALVAVAALLALRLLPALLQPPEPPPLEADVGLPKVAVEAEPRTTPESHPPGKPPPRRPTPPRNRGGLDPGISSRPKSPPRKQAKRGATEIPAPAPAPVPPPAPEPPPPTPLPVPAPAPVPEPPPPPDDGSMEFAPH